MNLSLHMAVFDGFIYEYSYNNFSWLVLFINNLMILAYILNNNNALDMIYYLEACFGS